MPTATGPRQLIHDWNHGPEPKRRTRPVAVLDDTLRDGLQNASVRMPALAVRRALIERAVSVGVECVNLGLPSASERAFDETLELCRWVAGAKLPIRVACAGRTVAADMRRIVEVAERSGLALEAHCFVGSSSLRSMAEGWTPERLERWSAEAVSIAARAGLHTVFVTEDTTRSAPELLTRLFQTALEHGAERLCLCDTVGHSTPEGVRRLLGFTRELAARAGRPIALDWHGHNDRGLGLANALAAAHEGADRIHATAFGIGERVGNTPLELLILNLELEGYWQHDVRGLLPYAEAMAEALEFPIPKNYPLLGENAFRTATGVHAAAIEKARAQSPELSDLIYSAVPASRFGRTQEISVGYMSGSSNVASWLARRGVPATKELVSHILAAAKQSDHILSDAELEALVREHRLKNGG